MPRRAAFVLLLALALATALAPNLGCRSGGANGPIALTPDDPALADLAFLAGAWTTGPADADRVEEHWSQPAAGTLVGVGRTVRGGQTVFFEHLRVERTPDGVFYVAAPRGGQATRFKLVESRPGYAAFENPDHDFPTRIAYRLQPDGRLHARIEGTQRGRPAAEDWHYRRAILNPVTVR